MKLNVVEFTKQLIKNQGIQTATKISEDNLKISLEAVSKETVPFSDEIMLSMGDSKRQKVMVNQKKHDKRLKRNLNFWKQVTFLIKKQGK